MTFSLSDTWLAQLPPDFYDQLAHCLSLHGMVCAELFSRTGTELVRQLAAHTPLDAATVAELNTIQSQEQLLTALRRQPDLVYDMLLLGRLGLDTSLAEPVLRFVRQQMSVSEEQIATIKAYCQELSETFLGSVEQHLAETDRAVAGELGQHRLHIEQAFFVHGAAAEADDDPDLPTVATVRFNDPQLQMIRLAVLLVFSLPTDTDLPFIRAVARMPALQPGPLEQMSGRLGALQPGEQIALTMPELVLLYQAMQVCGLVFVTDVLATLGLEDFMGIGEPAPAPTTETTGRAPMTSRQAVGEMVSGFTEWVQANFDDADEVGQARQEIAALTDLL